MRSALEAGLASAQEGAAGAASSLQTATALLGSLGSVDSSAVAEAVAALGGVAGALAPPPAGGAVPASDVDARLHAAEAALDALAAAAQSNPALAGMVEGARAKLSAAAAAAKRTKSLQGARATAEAAVAAAAAGAAALSAAVAGEDPAAAARGVPLPPAAQAALDRLASQRRRVVAARAARCPRVWHKHPPIRNHQAKLGHPALLGQVHCLQV